VERRLRDALLGRRVLVTLCHGDFKLGNCLREGGRVTGIVDWDTFSEDDLALVDAGNAVGKLKQGGLELWRAALVEPDEAAARACADWFRATGTDSVPPRDLLLFWWLDRSSKHISGRVDPGGAWTKRHVAPLLDHV
jgi:aminoglycoside phosphotransferase (APT) family kinase protein